MKKNLRNILLIVLIILVVAAIAFVCYGFVKKSTYKAENPIVTMEVEGMGTIKLELYPDQAPESVSNFIALANKGYYNGLTFHRVVKDFMIQGGDKSGDGTGSVKLSDLKDGISEKDDKAYSIKGEFVANNVKNTVKLERGVIAMARADYSSLSESLAEKGYNSAGSQFFIVQGDSSNLNGLYAGFGKVTEGMEVVDQIADLPLAAPAEGEEKSEKPENPPVIKSVTVDTKGVDYGYPETLEPFDYYTWLMQQYGMSAQQ